MDRDVLKDLNREAVFSAKFGSTARFSPPTQRSIVYLSSFPIGLEIFSSFPLEFERFLLHNSGAFNFPPRPVTILPTMAQLEINISDRSSMTTATYQTGTQSKIFDKIRSPLLGACNSHDKPMQRHFYRPVYF